MRGFQQLMHKLCVIFRFDPCCADAHIDLRRCQIHRLCLLQRRHISGKGRIAFRCFTGGSQLLSDIAGQIFVCRLPTGKRIFSGRRVFVDDPLQLCDDALGILAPQQTCHKRQIHAGTLSNGYRQRFACRVYMVNDDLSVDGALGEHICLAFQLTGVLINNFQRPQQAVRRILLKGSLVRRTAQQSVLCGEGIISIVQVCLQFMDLCIGAATHLEVDQAAGNIPNGNHPANALHRGRGFADRFQFGRVLVVQNAVLLGIAEAANRFRFFHRRYHNLRQFGGVSGKKLCIRLVEVLNRCCKLAPQIGTLYRQAAGFQIVAVHLLVPDHRAEDHFRVLLKIAVDRHTVCGLAQFHPVRQLLRRLLPFLEKNDVRGDFCVGVLGKGIAG